jgi:predicted histidine transporter YuiF (NhaC family)
LGRAVARSLEHLMVFLQFGKFTLQVADRLVDPALLALAVVAFVILVVALVAVCRCDKSDIAKVIDALGQWWPWRRK